jgi:hypothetical protein
MTRGSSSSSNSWQGGQNSTVYDYTVTVAIKAGTQCAVKSTSSSQTLYLSYIEYSSNSFESDSSIVSSSSVTTSATYYKSIDYCTKDETEHTTTDYEFEQSDDYAHNFDCGEKILCVKQADVTEVNPTTSDDYLLETFELTAGSIKYYTYSLTEAGSYMLASTNSSVNIYYLRVDGMEGGNAAVSNVANVDFIYKDVVISSTDEGYVFLINDEEYAATNTRIYFSVNSFNAGVLLYFYRDDDGKNFYVGYTPATPSGAATFVALNEDLTIEKDYTPTIWTQ